MAFHHDFKFPESPERVIREFKDDAFERHNLNNRYPWGFFLLLLSGILVWVVGVFFFVDSRYDYNNVFLGTVIFLIAWSFACFNLISKTDTDFYNSAKAFRSESDAFTLKAEETYRAAIKTYKHNVLDALSTYCKANNYVIKQRNGKRYEDGKIYRSYKFSGVDSHNFKHVRYVNIRIF